MQWSLRAVACAGVAAVLALGADLARLTLGAGTHAGALDGRRRGGSLVVAGGGRMPAEVLDRFAELAGGAKARIVVVTTARPEAYRLDPARFVGPWKARGVASVRVLDAGDRPTADSEGFARQLDDATGVWFSGGLQSRLSGVYADTASERRLVALLARGGAVGGTSAGAAVMTRTMILGGKAGGVLEGRGLGLLPGAVVDQHFLRRNRLSRLQGVMGSHPGLVGFGVDEGTALVVGLSGLNLEVVGDSYVVACLPGADGGPPRVEFLRRGDRADLASLKASPTAIAHATDLDAVLSEGGGP